MRLNTTIDIPDELMFELERMYKATIDDDCAFDDKDIFEYILTHVAEHGLKLPGSSAHINKFILDEEPFELKLSHSTLKKLNNLYNTIHPDDEYEYENSQGVRTLLDLFAGDEICICPGLNNQYRKTMTNETEQPLPGNTIKEVDMYSDGRTIWVNAPDRCILRIGNIQDMIHIKNHMTSFSGLATKTEHMLDIVTNSD